MPYRDPAEDAEDALDAAEVAAFRVAVARRTRRLRVVVPLVAIGVVAAVASILWLSSKEGPKRPATDEEGCETHLVYPPSGNPIPVTVCR
jgi:hypothetical protein